MAFKRKAAVIEAIDLSTITPQDAEKRITAGVRKYATNEGNWSQADANTPYLGQITGMGIESSNLADITMSIERQFTTKMTKRVPVNGSATEFTLQEGELGKLRILEGQDAIAATPGLSIKMLMDHGHMPKDEAYLKGVVSFGYIMSTGEGYKLADALSKTLTRVEKLQGSERDEAKENLKTLAGQAQAYETLLADPAAYAKSRQEACQSDKTAHAALNDELRIADEKLKGLTTTDDDARVTGLKNEAAEVNSRLKMMAQKLAVSEESARTTCNRSAVEEARIQKVRKVLSDVIAKAQSCA